MLAKNAAARRLRQVLLDDRHPELVILGDELADEFMQAALKDAVHPAVLQTRANAAGIALNRSLPAIGARHLIQVAHDRLVAGRQRARQIILENEEVVDQ